MNLFLKYVPSDRNWTMEEIRDKYFKAIIPVLVFSVFAMTFGTIGNCLVLYIFKFKYKQSNHRYFIICLAACDLTGSLIGIPFLIADMTLTYSYDAAVCKISRFLSHCFGLCSAFIIMIIVIERYQKICKANGKQISYNMARRLCYFSIIFCIFVSLSSAFLYGKNTVQTEIHNVTVFKCHYQDKYKDTFFPLMYNAFLVLWFIVGIITVCASYTQIVCTIRAQYAAQNIICQFTRENNYLVSSDDVSSRSSQLTRTRTIISNRKSDSAIKAFRLAKMLFIVAAVFLCSYIPYFAVSLVSITKTNFLRSLNPVETAAIAVCLKSFLLNYFANPIVYGLLDGAFSAECQNLIYRVMRRR
ncbi:hypothetical protein ACJMK2_032619 [Sinanodonta woodiana]|uniref:G-protein coupled receptors family 1 profile domain-containing protein n=1 Tax=Sinanodonta woodiana TaxID=1069815 RepID=A0ABD3X675_SINWO